MAKSPTNTDLARIVNEGFIAVGKRLDTVEDKVETFHDFMIVQKDRDGRSQSSALNVSPDIIKLALLLAGIIAALVGAKAIQ